MKKVSRILVVAFMAFALLLGLAFPAFADPAGPQGNTTVAPSSGPSQPPQPQVDWWAVAIAILSSL